MYNWIKKHNIPIISVFIAIIILIVIPLCINEAYKKNCGYMTVWRGEDFLGYLGSAISAVGTIILGVIAWQQNTRILKIEENTFLASNAASALITEVTVTGIAKKVVNLKLHEEQILSTRAFDEENYFTDGGSITLTCKLEPLNQSTHVAMVNVKQVDVFCSRDGRNDDTYFCATNLDNRYTKVAISKNFDLFDLAILIPHTEKAKLINSLSSADSEIVIEMLLSLLSEKYVATELKCRAVLKNPDYDEKEKVYTHFKTTEEAPPICFWNGTSLINKQDIKIKSVLEGKT